MSARGRSAPLALVLVAAAALSAAGAPSSGAQTPPRGELTGTVVAEDGRAIEGASVRVAQSGGALTRESVTDARGAFRVAALPAGVYTVAIRRLGYRSAELPALRLAVDEARSLRVTLTQTPQRLSTIVVVTLPTAIDAATPELATRIDREVASLVPAGRTASSLVALVPAAHGDGLWGGAAAVANDYKLDGISVSHPGMGGDFLLLSVDWIDALEVRGLAAGAEYGNFQGGSVNAITRSGSNRAQASLRTTIESPLLAATNLNFNEEGSEPAGRREISGELLGPLAPDRLFYFLGGQLVDRDVRAPNLASATPGLYQRIEEQHADQRGLAKLTWLPAAGQRADFLVGLARTHIDHFGVNGVDDPAATQRVSAPTTFYEANWSSALSARTMLDARLAGFSARESRLGYAGAGVPAVELLQLGRQPTFQNAAFDERLDPSSLAGNVTWRTWQRMLGADHQLVVGGEMVRGTWRQSQIRNGGVTWRPYAPGGGAAFDPTNPASWPQTGSDWGGEIRIDSRVASDAAFVQDYVTLGTHLTVTPGLRYGRWAGWLTPPCPAPVPTGGCPGRFEAAHADAVDPRIGVVWDVTGRSDLALKAHWGRYHQEMFTLFFDRADGANGYSNHRFYYAAPALTDPKTTFTAAERDSLTGTGGFSTFYDEAILDESGRVQGYRQPYVDQTVLGVEKTLGPGWKVELLYTHRRNGDIVGLIDRNLAQNYSVIRNVSVQHRLGFGRILDANGRPLVLPEIYVANSDLAAALAYAAANNRGGQPVEVAGYTLADLPGLQYKPDVVLTAIPEAQRHYDQLTLSLGSYHPTWRAQGSLTASRLRGNVAGVTGHGTTGTSFSAGPFVRPNEGIAFGGDLPGATAFEGKLWITARLSHAVQGGLMLTHVLGDRFTPSFQLDGRYSYVDAKGNPLPDGLFTRVLGQTIFVEPRGSREYASRTNLDAHLEWRVPGRDQIVLTSDVFNVFGSKAVTEVKTTIDDQALSDPTSYLGAPRARVAPRTVRLGLRID